MQRRTRRRRQPAAARRRSRRPPLPSSADAVVPAKAGTPFRKSESLLGKVFPLGIHFLDQADLPRAIPLLEPLLSLNRFVHVSVHLEVDERMHTVFLRKSRNGSVAMRFDAIRQITRDPDVQRAIGLTGKDV